MKKFIKTDRYGQLYIDRILFESYFPVIFTCINDNDDIFICVCCQNNEKGCKWLVGKTECINIIRLLQDKITVRQLLLEHSSWRITVDYTQEGYAIYYNNSDWDENSLYLPKKDSYMYAENGEFDDDIAYFTSINNHVRYNARDYKRIAELPGVVSEEIGSIVEIMPFTSNIGSITIPSKLFDTRNIVKDLYVKWTMSEEEYLYQEEYNSVTDTTTTFGILTEKFCVDSTMNVSSYIDAA